MLFLLIVINHKHTKNFLERKSVEQDSIECGMGKLFWMSSPLTFGFLDAANNDDNKDNNNNNNDNNQNYETIR